MSNATVLAGVGLLASAFLSAHASAQDAAPVPPQTRAAEEPLQDVVVTAQFSVMTLLFQVSPLPWVTLQVLPVTLTT